MATSPDTAPYFEGFYNRSPGISSVGSYQAAGTPFITGSVVADTEEVEITFPAVTRSVTVINKDAAGNDALRVHFASKDTSNTISGAHYITLDAVNTSVTLNIKTKSIWISNASGGSSNFQLFAELTGIAPGNMWTLTGAGIDA
jgi:hypothetical protein